MATSKLHEETVCRELSRLEKEGYRVINMHNKRPDGIAVKDGKIYAVEIMGRSWKQNSGKWIAKSSLKHKRMAYSMFDDVIFQFFRYPKSIAKKESIEKTKNNEDTDVVRKQE